MALDRYGDPEEVCRDPRCQKPGRHGTDDEGRLIPCPVLKKHLYDRGPSNDYAGRSISARAQAAIEAAEREQR